VLKKIFGPEKDKVSLEFRISVSIGSRLQAGRPGFDSRLALGILFLSPPHPNTL